MDATTSTDTTARRGPTRAGAKSAAMSKTRRIMVAGGASDRCGRHAYPGGATGIILPAGWFSQPSSSATQADPKTARVPLTATQRRRAERRRAAERARAAAAADLPDTLGESSAAARDGSRRHSRPSGHAGTIDRRERRRRAAARAAVLGESSGTAHPDEPSAVPDMPPAEPAGEFDGSAESDETEVVTVVLSGETTVVEAAPADATDNGSSTVPSSPELAIISAFCGADMCQSPPDVRAGISSPDSYWLDDAADDDAAGTPGDLFRRIQDEGLHDAWMVFKNHAHIICRYCLEGRNCRINESHGKIEEIFCGGCVSRLALLPAFACPGCKGARYLDKCGRPGAVCSDCHRVGKTPPRRPRHGVSA